MSGSDDKNICIWDYHAGGRLVAAIPSGHCANIFTTKFMPNSDNRTIISCAGDHEVRAFDINLSDASWECTHTYTCHKNRVKKLSTFDNPYTFLSASEDGTVRFFDLRLSPYKGVSTWVNLHPLEINSISISDNKFCIGLSDPTVRVYDIRKLDKNSPHNTPIVTFCPKHLNTHNLYTSRGHITGVAFHNDEILASYSGDDIFLFCVSDVDRNFRNCVDGGNGRKRRREKSAEEDESSEDNSKGGYVQTYNGHRNEETVKGVSFFGPQAEYVASGSDDGRIFVWDKKTAKLVNLMQGDRHVVNVISGHPFDCVMATSGIENDVKIWQPIRDVPADLKEADQVAQSNLHRSRTGIVDPLSLLQYMVHTGALEFAIPGDEDDIDSESEDTGSGGGDSVECQLQ